MKNKLIDLFGADKVVFDEDVLKEYANLADGTMGKVPAAVVFPKSAEDVEKAINEAKKTNIPVVTVSSRGPRYLGNAVPSKEGSLVLDMSRMNKVLSINRQQRMAVVEPGVTYEEFLPALAEKDLTVSMPFAPKAGKSVLASVAEIEPRLNCIRQWNYVEPLRCLEVVWGDGKRMRTGDAFGGPADLAMQQSRQKWQLDAPGPMMVDYYRLITGSMGTMGVATWASIRCDILPKMHESFFAASDDLDAVTDFVYKVIYPRFSDELFIVNRSCLTALLKTRGKATTFKLPEWIAMVGIAGRDCAYELRVKGQSEDIEKIAQKCGLKLVKDLCGVDADEAMEMAKSSCPEGHYWKTESKGAFEDIFFMSTLDRASGFNDVVKKTACETGVRWEDIMVYYQPAHQGVSCHIEYVIPFDPANERERQKTGKLALMLTDALLDAGAYFSRPYRNWAKAQIGRDETTKDLIFKIKDIFDPAHIMNPGKLGEEI